MVGTVIIVKALTRKGREALLVQKKDEEALRAKYEGVSSWRIPRVERNYLKSVSAFFLHIDGLPMRHEIYGFGVLGQYHRSSLYEGIRQAFFDNGCGLEDFEVSYRE